MATLTGTGEYAWSYQGGADQESTAPGDSGWTIGGDHFKNTGQDWSSGTHNALVRADFAFKPSLDASGITDTNATLTLSGHAGSWWFKADNGFFSVNCNDATSASRGLESRLQKRTGYVFTAYSNRDCSTVLATAPKFTTTGVAIGFSNVAATTATMTIVGHTGAWWYQADTGPDNTCARAATTATPAGTTESLTGLTDGGVYTYTAYSKTTCARADELDTATLTMSDVSAGNLDESITEGGSCRVGVHSNVAGKCATAFTTGANHAGYTLKSLTARFDDKDGSPSNISVAIHAADTTNSSHPASAAKVTLTGSNPDTAGLHTFTCTGSGCDLAANTSYFVVMSTSDTTGSRKVAYWWRKTSSNTETLTPAGNGWSIADGGLNDLGSGWTAMTRFATTVMHVAADSKTGFAATSVAAASATLTLSGHTDAWYYKRTHGPADATCRPVAAGTITASPPGLVANTPLYGYTAYSASGCTGTTIGSTAYFSTADAYVENLGTGTIDGITGHLPAPATAVVQRAAAFDTGNAALGYTLKGVTLQFAATTGSPANVVVAIHEPASAGSSDPKTTALVTLTGADQPGAGLHTYACSGSGCALARNTTYLVKVSAPNSPQNGYHSLRLTTSDAETAHPAASGWSIADTSRVKSGGIAWTASGNGETFVAHIAAEANVPTLTASAITATGATLTIAHHTAQWWYKADTGPDATCQGPVAANTSTKALTGLTASTSYVYKAYSASGCADTVLLATASSFTTLTPSLTVSRHHGDDGDAHARGPLRELVLQVHHARDARRHVLRLAVGRSRRT